MDAYEVFLTPTAHKDYTAIRDAKLKCGVNRIIDNIKKDPHQYKKLSGPLSHLRSAKTFSFRVLYQVEEKRLMVLMVSIDHRKDAYK